MEVHKLLLNLIDDPIDPMRTQVDEDALLELGRSMKEVGQIQPITVRKNGDRYEVIAGHRRTMASKMVGLEYIDAIISEVDSEQGEVIKMHENLCREDVNPVDQAFFMAGIMDKLGYSVSQFAQMVKRSENWVNQRLELCHYEPYILEAIKNGKLSMAAARWLQLIDDDLVRHMYCDYAVRGGLTAGMAQAWYSSWKSGVRPPSSIDEIVPFEQGNSEPVVFKVTCPICRVAEDPAAMALVYAHQECVDALAAMAAVAPQREESMQEAQA